MKSLLAVVSCSLAMLSIMARRSPGQAPKPSVYVEPTGRFGASLASSMIKERVSIDLATDRAHSAYVLSASPITSGTTETGDLLAPNEITVANVSVALSDSATSVVVWSDCVSEPTEGRKTEQVLADLVAKHLEKFIKKNHGGFAAIAKPERSYSIAALVGSLFRR